MPSIIWTRHFLKALYQDNKSLILLEKNGKALSSKCTRHIAIRYIFVTNRIAKGKLSIQWCSTAEMNADFMTKKSLQGATFQKFRDIIMGIKGIETDNDVSKKPSKAAGNEKSNYIQATKSRKIGKSSAPH
jgi:hypothetical protein